MNDIICEIILCFFAALGFCDLVSLVMNFFAFSKIKGEYKILIDSAADVDNFDFLIRQLESTTISKYGYGIITGVAVSDEIAADCPEFSELCADFGNISKVNLKNNRR